MQTANLVRQPQQPQPQLISQRTRSASGSGGAHVIDDGGRVYTETQLARKLFRYPFREGASRGGEESDEESDDDDVQILSQQPPEAGGASSPAVAAPRASPPSASARAPGVRSIDFTFGDKVRLNDGEWLNDSCIDWWLNFGFLRQTRDAEDRARLHAFSSFHYKSMLNARKLVKKRAGEASPALEERRCDAAYAAVRHWTRGVDIFDKHWSYVPVNFGRRRGQREGLRQAARGLQRPA